MTNPPNRAELPRHPDTTVVLLAPELFGTTPPDTAALIASLTRPHLRVRLLVRLSNPGDLTLAEAVAKARIEVQVLLPAGMDVPATALPLAQMPSGSTEAQTNDLTLALADRLFVPEPTSARPLTKPVQDFLKLAADLHKPFIIPGAPALLHKERLRGVANGLDPERWFWLPPLRCLPGRPEQFLLELFAFNWKGRRHDGFAESKRKLRKCFSFKNWKNESYFAPGNWKDVVTDRAAQDSSQPIVAGFDRLDRSALFGSRIHRDFAWIAYLAAAFAVLFAVLGSIESARIFPEKFWSGAELTALLVILAITGISRLSRLRDRWTACRFGAEQLRIARMCLPLMVVPAALCTDDSVPRPTESQRALARVKRVVRDQGLPDLRTREPLEAAHWLDLIGSDQTNYHLENHEKLECAERRMVWLTGFLFAVALGVVGWHFSYPDSEGRYSLIWTAAMPAFAAAMHGVTTRLGFVHRIQLSLEAEVELTPIRDDLKALITGGAPDWSLVRDLAKRAADAMARETTSWHSQVRRQQDDLT
nr:hypothetical protein [uncultured Rhodopila sp.]